MPSIGERMMVDAREATRKATEKEPPLNFAQRVFGFVAVYGVGFLVLVGVLFALYAAAQEIGGVWHIAGTVAGVLWTLAEAGWKNLGDTAAAPVFHGVMLFLILLKLDAILREMRRRKTD